MVVRIKGYFFEIPIGNFRLNIGKGILFAHRRNSDFQQYFIPFSGRKVKNTYHLYTLDRIAGNKFFVIEKLSHFDGFRKFYGKIQTLVLCPTGRKPITCVGLRIYFFKKGCCRLIPSNTIGKVYGNMSLFGFRESVFMNSYPFGRGQFNTNIISFHNNRIISGFHSFVLMSIPGCISCKWVFLCTRRSFQLSCIRGN